MTIQGAFASKLTLTETYTQFVDSADATVTFNGLNTEETLNATSTPAITMHSVFEKALSTGTGTIDLTAIPVVGQTGITQDGTGLKVQVAKFSNPSTNANAITVTFGASNGYLLGGTAWKLILQPGEEWTYKGLDTSPDVGGSAKDIDLAGTGSQVLDVQLWLG